MYKVYFFEKSSEYMVISKSFVTFEQVIEFAKTLPENSVLEIKQYENSNNN
jgi:hypothetical protein